MKKRKRKCCICPDVGLAVVVVTKTRKMIHQRNAWLFLLLTNAYSLDDGGWFTEQDAILVEPGPCNIAFINGTLTQEKFLNHFASKKPFAVDQATDNLVFRKACSKENLIKKYGKKVVRLSTANTYSYKKVDVPLQEYIVHYMKPQRLNTPGNETLYWFGDNDASWNTFFTIYKPPPFELPGMVGVYSFGAAAAGTGVPFHFHGPGFAEMIYGRKRWFLYPPEIIPDFHPNQTTLQWFFNEYPKLQAENKPFECTISPGQAIYFPDRWWHATLNIDNGVFISTFLGPK